MNAVVNKLKFVDVGGKMSESLQPTGAKCVLTGHVRKTHARVHTKEADCEQ